MIEKNNFNQNTIQNSITNDNPNKSLLYDIQNIWNETILQIQNSVPASEFNTWFTRMRLEDFKNDFLIISVPSAFIKNKIENSYKNLIEEALNFCGLNCHISINVNQNYNTRFQPVRQSEFPNQSFNNSEKNYNNQTNPNAETYYNETANPHISANAFNKTGLNTRNNENYTDNFVFPPDSFTNKAQENPQNIQTNADMNFQNGGFQTSNTQFINQNVNKDVQIPQNSQISQQNSQFISQTAQNTYNSEPFTQNLQSMQNQQNTQNLQYAQTPFNTQTSQESGFYRQNTQNPYPNARFSGQINQTSQSIRTSDGIMNESQNIQLNAQTGGQNFTGISPIPPRQPNPTLNPAYTFETFVPGENSLFVYNACLAISKNPGSIYNPCLIYGGVGLGKTHLLQSIGNAIHNNFPKNKVLYTTTENFMNDFFDSLERKSTETLSMNQFRNKYRKNSVLLIDDIQFLSGKTSLQDELFNTFNELYDRGQQLVFTCDRPVEELKDITDRLRSRFSRGLNVDIQPPNFETRVAIIQKKCRTQEFMLDRNVIEYIANNIVSNVRMLESCITKLKAYSDIVHEVITLDKARDLLKQNIFHSNDTSGIKMDTIIKTVADFFKVDEADIKGKGRNKSIVLPRQISMYVCNELLGENTSSTEIAREFGGKNHSTVLHNISKVKDMMNNPESDISNIVNKLMEQIKANINK